MPRHKVTAHPVTNAFASSVDPVRHVESLLALEGWKDESFQLA